MTLTALASGHMFDTHAETCPPVVTGIVNGRAMLPYVCAGGLEPLEEEPF